MPEKKHYYSPSQLYCANVPGRQHPIQFMPIGNADKWGRFEASNPEDIATLDAMIASGNEYIVTEQEFYERTTPQEVQISQLRQQVADALAENKKMRSVSK